MMEGNEEEKGEGGREEEEGGAGLEEEEDVSMKILMWRNLSQRLVLFSRSLCFSLITLESERKLLVVVFK